MKYKNYMKYYERFLATEDLSCQKYSMKCIYSTSQMSKLSLTLCTFSVTSLVASLFLTLVCIKIHEGSNQDIGNQGDTIYSILPSNR